MNEILDALRRLLSKCRLHAGWLLGLVIAVTLAAYFWIGRDTDVETPPPAVAVAPPADDVSTLPGPDSPAVPPVGAIGQSGDVIPPDEP